jgi:transcriptional regulator with XRE-family HTH domain
MLTKGVVMSGLLSTIRQELEDKEFRQSYVAENSRRGLAYQIKAMREAQGWSQAEFARRAGKPQSNIHRWEDPSYGKFSVSTLIEVASIFDVGLIVRFASFGELLASVTDLRPERLAVPTYDQEKNTSLIAVRPGSSALAAFMTFPEQSNPHELAANNVLPVSTALAPAPQPKLHYNRAMA